MNKKLYRIKIEFRMNSKYQGLVVRKTADKKTNFKIETMDRELLPQSEVLIRVKYSTINYKDLMSVQGNPAITRRFPHTPGIDAVGVVEKSISSKYNTGDRVAILSTAMGMSSPGGFGQYISVPENWVVALPDSMPSKTLMCYGTAGITALLAVLEIIAGGDYQERRALVTGATGGVGSFAVALLKSAGFEVSACSGREDQTDFLLSIGADEVLARHELEDEQPQNLLKPRWWAAVDTVGGRILANTIKQIGEKGTVTAMGMVNNTIFETNVLPFILRAIRLIGINAEMLPATDRIDLIGQPEYSLAPQILEKICKTIPLSDLEDCIHDYLKGKISGRIIIDLT